MEPNKIYVTVKQFAEECKRRGWPSQGALRKLIFERNQNGYSSAFKWHGKRVLIDVDEFWKCFERRGKQK